MNRPLPATHGASRRSLDHPSTVALALASIAILAAGCDRGDAAVAARFDASRSQPIDSAPEPASSPGATGEGAVAAEPPEAPGGSATSAPAAPGAGAAATGSPAPAGHSTGHASAGTSAAAEDAGGATFVSWELLGSVDYQPPDPFALPDGEELEPRPNGEVFPPEIAALDGREVAIEGFMVPLEYVGERVGSFLLARFMPGCCFGLMPSLDEWVEVEIEGSAGAEHHPFRPVLVRGELEVGEALDEYGYVGSIYRMRTEGVEEQW